MKKLLFSSILLFTLSNWAVAQRYAYVDTQYILDQIPEYTQAQEQLNNYSEQWMIEIEAMFSQVDKKKDELMKEGPLLPAEMRESRQKEIDELEQKAKELQKQRFGVGGDLFAKRQELIAPIQDRIFEAIQQIAADRNYAFVFDKANQSNLLYADPKFDMSDQVLRKMGIKVVKN
jgi:outer membrane protein